MADTWADYASYPRTCHRCGGKVSISKGAFFRSVVGKGGKIIERTSECAKCFADDVAAGTTHSTRCLCPECTEARALKATA
jgi:hypothetical protein